MLVQHICPCGHGSRCESPTRPHQATRAYRGRWKVGKEFRLGVRGQGDVAWRGVAAPPLQCAAQDYGRVDGVADWDIGRRGVRGGMDGVRREGEGEGREDDDDGGGLGRLG